MLNSETLNDSLYLKTSLMKNKIDSMKTCWFSQTHSVQRIQKHGLSEKLKGFQGSYFVCGGEGDIISIWVCNEF